MPTASLPPCPRVPSLPPGRRRRVRLFTDETAAAVAAPLRVACVPHSQVHGGGGFFVYLEDRYVSIASCPSASLSRSPWFIWSPARRSNGARGPLHLAPPPSSPPLGTCSAFTCGIAGGSLRLHLHSVAALRWQEDSASYHHTIRSATASQIHSLGHHRRRCTAKSIASDLPGFTRSVYKRDHALITPESYVFSPLPDWVNTLGAYLISPAIGAHFTMYLANMKGVREVVLRFEEEEAEVLERKEVAFRLIAEKVVKVRNATARQVRSLSEFLKIMKRDWREQGAQLKTRINTKLFCCQAAVVVLVRSNGLTWGQLLPVLLIPLKPLVVSTCSQADMTGSSPGTLFEAVVKLSCEIIEFGWTKDRALVDTFIMRLAAYVRERNDYEEPGPRDVPMHCFIRRNKKNSTFYLYLSLTQDVAIDQDAGYEKPLIARLTIKPGKIASLAKSIRTLANMEDPINQILKKTQVADDLVLQKTSCPLGVLLIVFESRPDALVQVIIGSVPCNVGEKLIGLVTKRDEIADLLKLMMSLIMSFREDVISWFLRSRHQLRFQFLGMLLDDGIDLVIPRGSNKLVFQIKASTKIPVLGHADGICHVYIDKSADMDMAKRIVMDAKIDYPAACNAMTKGADKVKKGGQEAHGNCEEDVSTLNQSNEKQLQEPSQFSYMLPEHLVRTKSEPRSYIYIILTPNNLSKNPIFLISRTYS
ncbi:hypothetical protein ABZP36_032203 [Zizania latifolia]